MFKIFMEVAHPGRLAYAGESPEYAFRKMTVL